MKRILILSALLLCVLCGAKDKTIKVLSIGNTFSKDVVEYDLHKLAEADGQKAVIGHMFINGCSIQRHCEEAYGNGTDYSYRKIGKDGKKTVREGVTLAEALQDENWDYITLHQHSSKAGILESFEPHFGQLVEYIRTHAKGTPKLVYYEVWPYTKNCNLTDFANYDYDQNKMYNSLNEVASTLCEKYGLELIPGATAMQNARSCHGGATAYTVDGKHLNQTAGRYLLACTWYEALWKRPVESIGYAPEYLPHSIIEASRKSAHAAVEKPFEVTPGLVKIQAPHNDFNLEEMTLPDPLKMQDGSPVQTVEQWEKQRRPELVSLFESEVYGKAPGRPEGMHYKVMREDDQACFKMGVLREIRIFLTENESKNYIDLVVVTPTGAKGPVPTFLHFNLFGNASLFKDELTPLSAKRIRQISLTPMAEPGSRQERCPLAMILGSGYGYATFFRGDIDPDFDDGFANGVHPLFYKEGQTMPAMDEWGTLAAWAWGMSRCLDYLETDPLVDASRVIALGHSRGGKTALLAGAMDQRFAMAVSNDSGCGGAALFRRHNGEQAEAINMGFPHWFCGNFKKYDNNEDALPVDQHELIALMAPRPVYVASAELDGHADPKGEFLSCVAASPVYGLYGEEGVGAAQWPSPLSPLHIGHIGYHVRTGAHQLLPYDWQQFIAFADKYLK